MSDTRFRPAIWAAVSSRPQVVADISLPDQIKACRAWLAARGMEEAHEPLEVKGESRQTVVSLTEAEAAIPELRELLNLAADGKINLVTITDTDRFRGLLDQVVRVLSQYGCQVYSLAQPVELVDPAVYRYFDNDAQMLTFGLAQLMSHSAIAKFQRAHARGMVTRVDKKGLPPAAIPFGYRRPAGQEYNRSAIPVVVESERVILQRMRADYLAGKPQRYIADWLNAEGVVPRRGGRWGKRQVVLILTSPFYCGLIQRHTMRTRTDPRTRKRLYERLPPEEWVLSQGNHEPIWTVADRQEILDAKASRAPDRHGAPRRTVFSRLLRCAACDAMLHSWTPPPGSGYADFRMRYICSDGKSPPHGKLLAETVARDLRPALEEYVEKHLNGAQPALASPDAELAAVERSLAECDAKRTRHEQAHGAGLMPMRRLAERLAEVDAEESGLLARRAKLMNTAARAHEAGQAVSRAQAFLERYDDWMAGPPAEANAALRRFLDHVTCSRDGIVEIKLVG